jgi:hypothetical protein
MRLLVSSRLSVASETGDDMGYMEDIAVAVEAFGTKDVGLVWGLGMTPWKDDAERDQFLQAARKNYQPEE